MIWDEHAYLMVDLKIIERTENCSMVREEPFKYSGNPISRAVPWRALSTRRKRRSMEPLGQLIWCVHREGGVFRAWSGDELTNEFSYTESRDGVHFKPVKVGALTINGTRNNNRVRVGNRPEVRACHITHDPLDGQYPYKCVVMRPGTTHDLNPAVRAKYRSVVPDPQSGLSFNNLFVWGIARSQDGFSWELPPHDHVLIDSPIECAALHRALDGGLVIGNQMASQVSDRHRREVTGWVTYDGQTAYRVPEHLFSLPDFMTLIADKYFGKTGVWSEQRWVQSHVNLVVARKGPSMIALHGFLYGSPHLERYAQVIDTGLAVSDTGYLFHMVSPFRPFLRCGERGAWDSACVRQQAMTESDDRTLIYYMGSDNGNTYTNRPDATFAAGLAYLPRDRFGYFVLRVNMDHAPRARRGLIELKPIVLPQKPAIAVNVTHATKARTVKVELRDAHGRAIPGFAFTNCVPITEDGLHLPVRWKGRHLARLAGQEVKLTIELYSPDCAYADHQSPRIYGVYTESR